MRRLGLVLMLCLLAACDDTKPPTAPSAVTPVAVAPAAPVTPAAPPVVVTPPPVVVAPAPPVAPVTPSAPFTRNDCDWASPLGALRCYNPSAAAITLTAALNTPDCGTSFGAHTITIPPKTNGYFTLPSPACDRVGQVDVYYGAQQGSCRAPDFTSQRTYPGPACPPPPPPPPPPPCVDPGWGPWITHVVGQPAECVPQRRERVLCSGERQVEFRCQ